MLMFIVVALVVGVIRGLINELTIVEEVSHLFLPRSAHSLRLQGLPLHLRWPCGEPRLCRAVCPDWQWQHFSLDTCLFIIFGVAALSYYLVLTRSPFGLRLYLMGSNAKAATTSRVLITSRILMFTYITSALLASLAGIIIASGASSAKWDYGTSYSC